jgi:hypothetical protein
MIVMRRWIGAFAGLVLSACAQTYAGPMSATPDYVVGASPYGFGATAWNSPYGYNSNYGGSNRFSPEKGLTCDRSRRICYDRYGVDYFETQKYLGSKSAKYGAKRYGEQVFIFAPQQGVVCDRRSQSCSDSGGLNATLTRKYFSKDDTRRVGAWSSANLFSPHHPDLQRQWRPQCQSDDPLSGPAGWARPCQSAEPARGVCRTSQCSRDAGHSGSDFADDERAERGAAAGRCAGGN